MRKEFVMLLIAAAFLSGFLIGRRFPVHRYIVWELPASPALLLDTNTGKACSPFVERRFENVTIPKCPD